MKKDKKDPSAKFAERTLAHIEALKDIYKVDMENLTITVPLHFESASDIVAENIGTKKHPVIQRDLLVQFSDNIHNIPSEFKINFDIKIKDYEDYDPKDLNRALLNAFEYFQYDVAKEKNISGLKVAILAIVGITIFCLLYYVCAKNLFGPQQESSYIHNTIHEIIASLAGVCLFEDALILFLPERTYGDVYNDILHKINFINFMDDNDKVVSSINYEDMAKHFNIETKKEIHMRRFFLICGTFLIGIALCKVIDIVEAFIIVNNFELGWLNCITSILTPTILMVCGIAAISVFRDKGPLKNAIIPLGFVAFGLNLLQLIFVAVLFNKIGAESIKLLVFSALILVVVVFYIICAFYLRKLNKRLDNDIKQIQKNA